MVWHYELEQAGGPFYPIQNGRRDGRRSKIEDTRSLPPPFLNSTELINLFGNLGFNVREMVALSGKTDNSSKNNKHFWVTLILSCPKCKRVCSLLFHWPTK